MRDIVRTDDVLGGSPRIEGRRIGVRHVKERVVDGDEDPFAVAGEYNLDVADVFAALAYYYDNRELMRKLEGDREVRLDELRQRSTDRSNREQASERA